MNYLTGQKFGRLTVLEYVQGSKYLCRCDCGNMTTVLTHSLKKGFTKSCGCIRREVATHKATKHGGATDPLYHVLNTMHQRCENPKSRDFGWYGAKGVAVCAEWSLVNFSNFREWAYATGYRPGLTIDRIDPAAPFPSMICVFRPTAGGRNAGRRNLTEGRRTP